jgi:hypothetical protein
LVELTEQVRVVRRDRGPFGADPGIARKLRRRSGQVVARSSELRCSQRSLAIARRRKRRDSGMSGCPVDVATTIGSSRQQVLLGA